MSQRVKLEQVFSKGDKGFCNKQSKRIVLAIIRIKIDALDNNNYDRTFHMIKPH